MRVLIDDVIDLVRGRVKSLPHYQYPRWQLALFLLLCSVVVSPSIIDLDGPIAPQLSLLFVVTWLQIALLARFMGWWLKPRGQSEPLDLFGVIVVVNGLQLLEPLTSWLDPKPAAVAQVFLSLLSLAVLINALAGVSERSRWRVAGGMGLLIVLIMILMTALLSLGVAMGWITLPDLQAAVQGVSSGAASKAL